MQVSPASKVPGANRKFPVNEGLRAIAYSMDTLIPGLYLWFGNFAFRLGGTSPDDEPYRYPGMIHAIAGIGIVLPGYHIWTTYKGSYDPR